MADQSGSGGNPQWLAWISTGLAAILGTSLLITPRPSSDDRAPGPVVVGAQVVATLESEELHHVQRIRGPLHDYFGCAPDRTSKVSACQPCDQGEDRPPWQVDAPLQQHLDGCDLEFLLLTVADPIDSVSGYMFDGQIDALQKALSVNPDDSWNYSGGYLPWQAYKDRRATDPKVALNRLDHWYQDEPGLLVFRFEDSNLPKPKLLLVYLVGELPTIGVHRSALDRAIREIATLSGWSQTPQAWNNPVSALLTANSARGICASNVDDRVLRIVGPTFSGGIASLRAGLAAARTRYSVLPQIISGSATAVHANDFKKDEYLGATVCSWEETKKALLSVAARQRIAWLVETGTSFGEAAMKRRSVSNSKDGNGQVTSKDVADGQSTVFQWPVGIARARSGFEQKLSELRQQKKSFKSSVAITALPFEADEATHDTPPLQTPRITSPSVELILDEIIHTINVEKFPFAVIVATDARDTIFLAENLKIHCPQVQLLIPEPDILLAHPEYTDSLRGAIVASSYPLFPEGLDACSPGSLRTVLSSQSEYGTFNAILLHRLLARNVLYADLTADPHEIRVADNCACPVEVKSLTDSFAGLWRDDNRLAPTVWLHTVGYDRFYPLTVCGRPRFSANRCTKDSPSGVVTILTEKDHSGVHFTSATARTPNSSLVSWLPAIAGFFLIGAALFIGTVLKDRGGDLLSPLYFFQGKGSEAPPCCVALLILSIWVCFLIPAAFVIRLLSLECKSEYSPDLLPWLTEGYLFSGVSLMLPMFCAAAALVSMCYMKLRQRYLVREEELVRLKIPQRNYDCPQTIIKWLWREWEPSSSRVWSFLFVLVGVVCTFAVIWQSTHDVSHKPALFHLTAGLIVAGYLLWWICALHAEVMRRALCKQAKSLFCDQRYDMWHKPVLTALHKRGMRGVYRLLLGANPSTHDAVANHLKDEAGAYNALGMFRVIHFRLVIIRNQFVLLLLGAVLLFLATAAYPFTSSGSLTGFATVTLLTFVGGVCVSYWRMDNDEYLSYVVGTEPNQVEWHWGSVSFLGRNLLLGVFVLIAQLVPGTWAWLGGMLGTLLRSGQ